MTGITTRQMQQAPIGAIYVWVNNHLDYPRSLARDLGRSDLKIMSPNAVRLEKIRGKRGAAVVVDHATEWTKGICEVTKEFVR